MALLLLSLLLVVVSIAHTHAEQITINWGTVTGISNTTTTLQVVMHPLLTRQSPIHDNAFKSLAALNAQHVRFASWFPFPHLSVPELDAPSGLHQCQDVEVNYAAHLSCERGGGAIQKVEFASFGLHTGGCGGFTSNPQCSSPNSTQIITQLCVGHSSCDIPADPHLFGDPCPSSASSYRLAVQVSCDPPQNNTYWDFTWLDPVVEDFMSAAGAGSPNMEFCTFPDWLYEQADVHHYPDNPYGTDWGYQAGTQLIDPTCQQVGEWYGRLAAWYIQGGFTDEYGYRHTSNHHYPIRMWEILNEELHEHNTDIHTYICLYDAIVQNIRRLADPDHLIEFVGMAYANVDVTFYDDFSTFLNHSNHAPGIPLDWLSYHWYSEPGSRTDITSWEGFVNDNLQFVTIVQKIESIRLALSPETKTTIDEIGVILPDDNDPNAAVFPLVYFNAAGAAFAHLFGLLSNLGIQVLGSSQLMGSPELPNVLGGLDPQFPSVTLLNWTTGTGTARYWVLDLLIDSFQPGYRLIQTSTTTTTSSSSSITSSSTAAPADVFAQAYESTDVVEAGLRRILLVNTKSASSTVTVKGVTGGEMRVVDEATGGNPARTEILTSDDITLARYAVAVITLNSTSIETE